MSLRRGTILVDICKCEANFSTLSHTISIKIIALGLKSSLQNLHGIFDTKPEILKFVIPIMLFALAQWSFKFVRDNLNQIATLYYIHVYKNYCPLARRRPKARGC